MLRACKVCGRPVHLVGVNETREALCDFHAWTLQQQHAERERAGGSPPPQAYREVRLPENWRA